MSILLRESAYDAQTIAPAGIMFPSSYLLHLQQTECYEFAKAQLV